VPIRAISGQNGLEKFLSVQRRPHDEPQLLPKKVTAHDVPHRLRLGSSPPVKADHWFDFERDGHEIVARQMLEQLPQAERSWNANEEKA
jgi:hypothetical protein